MFLLLLDQFELFLVVQIDLLAEISIAPRIMTDVDGALKAKQMKAQVDEYLKVDGNNLTFVCYFLYLWCKAIFTLQLHIL